MTPSTPGARFLAAFNNIEDHLRTSLQADEHVEFAGLARRYAEKKRLPRNHLGALLAFASLRNAISHGRYYGGRPIAEGSAMGELPTKGPSAAPSSRCQRLMVIL